MRLKVLGLLAMAALACVAAPAIATAQQAAKVWRIGLLDLAASDPGGSVRWNAFRERLRELGYVEGQNVVFESRWGDGEVGRLRSLAVELVDAKVDIMTTASTEAALAAKQATSSIPIVMATGGDPVELRLAASLARPGGNVTGVISLIRQLTGKRFELLKQFIPRASRVALLRDPENRSSALSASEARSVAKSLGVVVQVVNVRRPGDLDAAFLAMKRARTDAVMFAENTLFIADRRHIAELAVKHRLPMMVPEARRCSSEIANRLPTCS